MRNISKHFNEDLWPKIIEVSINNALKKVDKNFLEYVDFKSLVDEEYKSHLSNYYERKREWLKRIYFGNTVSYEEKIPDMHKIAAVICRSIIGCKPFSFDVDKANKYKKDNNKDNDFDWIINNYFINYKVAVNCAFLITLYDLIDKIGDEQYKRDCINNPITLVQSLVSKGFDLYKNAYIITQHEPFYKSIILNLAINDTNKRDFDYLGFATMCFQLQQYEVIWNQINKTI